MSILDLGMAADPAVPVTTDRIVSVSQRIEDFAL